MIDVELGEFGSCLAVCCVWVLGWWFSRAQLILGSPPSFPLASTALLPPSPVPCALSPAALLLAAPHVDSLSAFCPTRAHLVLAHLLVFRSFSERRVLTVSSRLADSGLLIVFSK